MPSLKRMPSFPNAKDQSDRGSESAGSASPSDSRKRQRTTESSSSNNGTEAGSHESDAASLPDDLTMDDAELEFRQTQLIQEKYAQVEEDSNIPADHGILERVECYNFMCHDHFQVELGPLINFIVGKNGSGKSAILTGITLCLGGKASATNRGQSLRNFIKEGRENASIVVRIRNQGDGAYMPDDYGKSIIDMARQFLSTSSPAEKYKFFVKGVQLEQLDQDYRLIEESVDQIEEKLRGKVQDLGFLTNRKDAARKKLELSDQHDSLRERKRIISHQMAWAQVEEMERKRDALNDQVSRVDSQIADAEAAIGRFDDALQAVEADSERAAEHAFRADYECEEARSERERIKEKLDETMSQRHDLQAEQRQIKEYLEAAKTRIAETQHKMEIENRRLTEASDGGYARKQEECEQSATRAIAARKKYDDHQPGVTSLHEDVKIASKNMESAQRHWESKRNDVRHAEDRLRALTREDGQRRDGFPDRMPALLKAIQQEASFTSKPIGPIGAHITLLKPKWSSILENSFGGTLSSFIVSNKRDMSILSNLMVKVNCQCQIFIGQGGHIDTSAHEPDPNYDTALRILQIDNHMRKASAVLFDGQRPRNVKRCFCIDSRDRRRGIHLSYNRMGEPSQAPVGVYHGHPRMQSDLASQISAKREVIQDLERQLHDSEQELRSSRDRWEKCKQAKHFEMPLDKDNAEDGQIESLRAALQEAEDEKSHYEMAYADSQAAMSELMDKLKLIRREIKAQDEKILGLEKASNVAQSENLQVQNRRRELISDKNTALESIAEQKRDRDEVKEKLDEASSAVLRYIDRASHVSARVPVDEGETGHSLDQKLVRLERDLARYDAELGAPRDEIAAEAGRAETAWRQAKDEVDNLTKLAQFFKDTLNERKKRWEIFRSHISSRAKAQFTYLLSERGFRGRLLTDHVGKLLDVQVEPDITKEDSTGRGAKTLSGGEKSFSQVCLLLALWEAMGSPIRCLDEFDVYMDHINRKMAIDMLMFAARRSIGRQFILITPGSKTDITISSDVRVKELAEPERGQTTLNFQR
ncbi:uncharacterized protein N7477_006508 [Penicillium maclennaniae]|uniref:uncharacterized protein n=1 Tax=Penicillium maclennaniae TaxID=1343394 RepID=UPI002540DE02|nr:uncharacterized protein N7477_006508 [Penicillium maclennaniae]KAJ5667938.1 hypothetical protein N7477_006508 [Penicillium maclennaniae]